MNRYNRITRKAPAGEMVARGLANTQAKAQTVDDEFAQAIARKLESRGVTKAPVLPKDEEPQRKKVLRILREDQEWQREYEARRKSEENTPQTTVGLIMSEIAKAATGSESPHIPLNGAQVLRAALAGTGTVTGQRV